VSDRPRRPFLRVFVAALLTVALVIGAGATAAAWFWHAATAPGPLPAETVVVVPKGVGTTGIGKVLAAAGIIENPFVFKLASRLLSGGAPLHAGEFKFPAHISTQGAMWVLIEDHPVLHRVTFAEGLSVSEVFDILTSTPELQGPLPAPPAEGSLLPQTYFFVLGDSRAEMIDRMKSQMDATLAQLWTSRDPGLPLASPKDAVTLASVVEKETAKDDERPRIAAVFYNRIKKDMPLQSDPTVIYALTLGKAKLDRPLSGADLRTDSPYNTYVVTGLPAGPIANPGVAALKAVLHPLATKDLYFVADGTGGHVFAETLEQHNQNVAKWRKFLKSQAAGKVGTSPDQGD
jgi:UPF0755 protein